MFSLSANLILPEQKCRDKGGLSPSFLVVARLDIMVLHHLRRELYIQTTNATMGRTSLSTF